jgi:gamma-glutamyltranspeptidase
MRSPVKGEGVGGVLLIKPRQDATSAIAGSRCGIDSERCVGERGMPGVIVAPQPPAVDVGAEILAQGGHAIDAVVAAAFMQMVVDPTRRFLPKW